MHRYLLLSVPFLLSACASVSVKDVSKTGDGASKKPDRIDVAPFEVVMSGVKENPTRKAPGKLHVEAQLLLKSALVSELNKMGIASAEVSANKQSSAGGWVIHGKITRLAEGNRLLRMSIGLGSGGTKIETATEVHGGVRGKTILRFATSGGSNAMPGGVTNPIPFCGVPTAIIRARDGITDDSARTARMIAGTIGNYLADRGWMAREKVPVVKTAKQ